jgi:hypothetical protein
MACDTSCKTCNNKGPNACLSCFDGKYLSGGTCNVCATGCETCSTLLFCLTCES